MVEVVNAVMLKVVRKVAKKYNVPPYSVLLLASACGKRPWRGCVPVVEYQQRERHRKAAECVSLV